MGCRTVRFSTWLTDAQGRKPKFDRLVWTHVNKLKNFGTVSLVIREEMPGDLQAIRSVNILAFGREAEADLVDLLRVGGKILLSLVAVDGDTIVGHIAYSPVTLKGAGGTLSAAGLGPMAVLPTFQRTGIGTALVRDSLLRLQKAGMNFVVVLGHPSYYPRFGFRPASAFNVQWEEDSPEDAFMIKELRKGSVPHGGGTIQYAPEFSTV